MKFLEAVESMRNGKVMKLSGIDDLDLGTVPGSVRFPGPSEAPANSLTIPLSDFGVDGNGPFRQSLAHKRGRRSLLDLG